MQHWLGQRPQARPYQQRECDRGATDYRTQQRDGDEHPAEIDIEHFHLKKKPLAHECGQRRTFIYNYDGREYEIPTQ